MGAIIEKALCSMVWKVIGGLVLLPMGVLFLGYLIYMVYGILKEWRKE